MDALASPTTQHDASTPRGAEDLRPCIKGYVTADSGITEYCITTSVAHRRFVARRRFSAFLELHKRIAGSIGMRAAFPVAKAGLASSSVHVKKRRIIDLSHYLERVANHLRASNSPPPQVLLTFLNVDLSLATPKEAAMRHVVTAATSARAPATGDPRSASGGGSGFKASCGMSATASLFLTRVASGGDDAPSTLALDDNDEATAVVPAGEVDVELSKDVYATAFVLANNATEGMYHFSPYKNRQMVLLWRYLAFLVASQAFVLLCLVVIYPPVVDTASWFVDCDRPTADSLVALERALRRQGGVSPLDDATCASPNDENGEAALRLTPATQAYCEGLDVAFEFPTSTSPNVTASMVRMRKLEFDSYFYQNVFASLRDGYPVLALLQAVCCVWVTVQVYFVDFQAVRALLEFRDFTSWILPLRGETTRRNVWVLAIPLVQYALGVSIVAISCCIICASSSGFDAVMNSLAFTFISTVAEVFNAPLLRHYSSLAVDGLDSEVYGTDPIFYLVSEYDEGNSYGSASREQWALSWYIKAEDKVAGLITDFHFRHSPETYPRPNAPLIRGLQLAFFTAPVASLALCCAIGW